MDDDFYKILDKITEIIREPDPFSPNPPGNFLIQQGNVDGQVKIGKVRQTGVPFGLDLEELKEHTLITGRAGAGKTTLIYIMLLQLLKLGIPFWAFDFKQDYRHLAKTGKVLVFDWKSFRFNPLRPPEGVDPHIWMQAFTNVFCQVYWLLSGSKQIILSHIQKLYEDYGVSSGSDVYPTMLDLADSLKQHKLERQYGREAGFLESSQNRVSECLLSFGEMLNYDKGFSVAELLTKNVVFELEGILAENQAFLLNIILRHVFQYRISNNQRGNLQHIFLFDEAKTVYDRQREFSKELGIAEVAQFTSKIREFGEGLVVADQMPTELADSIKANVYAVICMSQSGGPNVDEMCRAMGLNNEQAEVCRILQSDKNNNIFEAIVKLNGKWLTPFIIYVMPYKAQKDVNDASLQELMSPILTELNKKLIPRTEYKKILEAKKQELLEERKEKAEQKEIADAYLLNKILINIKDNPFIDQKTRIQMLDLQGSSSTTDKHFKQLVAQGFVTVHRIGLGRGQSTMTLYEITDKGKEFAHMDKVEIPGKGDFKHKFWQHKIKEFFEYINYKNDYKNIEIEKRYGFKNVDIGFEMKGLQTAVEVELTSDHLIENIQKDFEAGCELIIVASPSKQSITSYKKRIEYYNKEYLNKIEFRVLSDFLD